MDTDKKFATDARFVTWMVILPLLAAIASAIAIRLILPQFNIPGGIEHAMNAVKQAFIIVPAISLVICGGVANRMWDEHLIKSDMKRRLDKLSPEQKKELSKHITRFKELIYNGVTNRHSNFLDEIAATFNEGKLPSAEDAVRFKDNYTNGFANARIRFSERYLERKIEINTVSAKVNKILPSLESSNRLMPFAISLIGGILLLPAFTYVYCVSKFEKKPEPEKAPSAETSQVTVPISSGINYKDTWALAVNTLSSSKNVTSR